MSQHFFSTMHEGNPVTVLLGWDRPLGHYFMVIERDQPAPANEAGISEESDYEEEYLYSNLNEKNPFNKSMDYFKSKLEQFGIQVPAQMFVQIELDQLYNVGNRRVFYESDGSFKEGGG